MYFATQNNLNSGRRPHLNSQLSTINYQLGPTDKISTDEDPSVLIFLLIIRNIIGGEQFPPHIGVGLAIQVVGKNLIMSVCGFFCESTGDHTGVKLALAFAEFLPAIQPFAVLEIGVALCEFLPAYSFVQNLPSHLMHWSE